MGYPYGERRIFSKIVGDVPTGALLQINVGKQFQLGHGKFW